MSTPSPSAESISVSIRPMQKADLVEARRIPRSFGRIESTSPRAGALIQRRLWLRK